MRTLLTNVIILFCGICLGACNLKTPDNALKPTESVVVDENVESNGKTSVDTEEKSGEYDYFTNTIFDEFLYAENETDKKDKAGYEENGDVLISVEIFGSNHFCDLIRREADKDKDDVLSLTERLAVERLIDEDVEYYRDPDRDINQSLDIKGLEWFPNLKEVGVCYADTVLLQNLPKLEKVSIYEGRIERMVIENCDVLSKMICDTVSVNLFVRNCKALTECVLQEANLGDSFFIDTPVLHIEGDNWTFSELTLDADAYSELARKLLKSKVIKRSETELWYELTGNESEQNRAIRFVNLGKDYLEMREDYFTADRKVFSDELSVDIYEKNDVNESGMHGFFVVVTRSDAKKETFVLYAKEMPKKDDFSFKVSKAMSVGLDEYSPNKGFYGTIFCDFILCYSEKECVKEVGMIEGVAVKNERKNEAS